MRQVRLGDFLEVQAGFAFKTEHFTSGEGMPLIRIRDLNQSQTVINYSGEYKPEFIVNSGDYLIGMDGNFGCYRWQGGPSLLNQRVCRLRNFREGIEPEYVFYGIQRKLREIEDNTSFVTVKHLSGKQVQNIEMPLPPIPEQRRIVDLLSRAEGIVRLRREAEKKAAELIPALFLDMFGDPAANPKGWPVQSLKSLVSFVSGGTPSKLRDDFWAGDLPWVSPKDMKRVGIDSAIDHVNRKVLTETAIKLIPVGSVLIVVRGMILIHTVPIAQSLVPITINQDMKALIPVQAVNGTYLLWSLRVRQAQLLSLVATAAHGTKKLETERLEAFSVPLPPLTVQTDFADKLTSIESIQSQQSTATAKAQATFDALLAQAFSIGRRAA